MKNSASLLLLVALGLTACSSSNISTGAAPVSSSSAASSQSASPQASSSTSSATDQPSGSSQASESASPTAHPSASSRTPIVTENGNVISGDTPSASATASATASASTGTGNIPAGATEVTTVRAASGSLPRIATLVTPSGNIGCDIFEGQGIGCGVKSLAEQAQAQAGQVSMSGWYFYTPADGATYDTGKSDAAMFMIEQSPQVIPYGTSVYFDCYVCDSEEAGLRCSNVDTGHGMFLNRDGVQTF